MLERRTKRSAGWAAVAVALACALRPEAAAAQGAETTAATPSTEELAAARALFVEAKKLETKGEWSAALERFEKVGRIMMTPQVRFHIALCQENLGRWVDAINGFELAAQEAQKEGKKAREVAENAPPRAEKLRARVARITFEIEGTVRSSEIFIDDKPVSVALAGTPIPVDPGDHVLEVRRGSEVVESRPFSLEEAGSETMKLVIDDPLPKPEPQVDPVPSLPRPVPSDTSTPEDDGVGRIPAYVVGGVGAAGLIAGGVLWGLRESSLSAVRCTDPDNYTGCNPDDRAEADLGQQYDVGSKIAFGVGGGLFAAGVVLFFVLAPDDDAPAAGAHAPRIQLAPYADAGAALRVTF